VPCGQARVRRCPRPPNWHLTRVRGRPGFFNYFLLAGFMTEPADTPRRRSLPLDEVRPPRVHPRTFTKVPTIRTADELVDTAFRKASKVTVHQSDPFMKMKATETSRVRTAQNSLNSTLKKYVKRFPSLDGLPEFYQELVDLLFDTDRLKKALGSLQWASERIDEVGDEAVERIKKSRHGDELLPHKSQAYGRFASLVKQVDKHLRFLDQARQHLRKLPILEWDIPTIVVAGYPNVGKSSLVRAISTGTPEVASYPFTTKGIVVGHFDYDMRRYQIVDTPGLLDRDLEKRNAIELQAIQALRHLGDVIVFLIDASEHCGYSVADQRELLAKTREAFPDTRLVLVSSKADLAKLDDADFVISSETREGLDELLAAAVSAARQNRAAAM